MSVGYMSKEEMDAINKSYEDGVWNRAVKAADHDFFGSWLDAGPSEFDRLPDDTARLKYVLGKIHSFRLAIGMEDE